MHFFRKKLQIDTKLSKTTKVSNFRRFSNTFCSMSDSFHELEGSKRSRKKEGLLSENVLSEH